jgi:hypothetical protein
MAHHSRRSQGSGIHPGVIQQNSGNGLEWAIEQEQPEGNGGPSQASQVDLWKHVAITRATCYQKSTLRCSCYSQSYPMQKCRHFRLPKQARLTSTKARCRKTP